MLRNDSKFTIAKYPINTMEIIKLSQVNIFMPVTNYFASYFASYFAKGGHFRSLFSSGNFSKKPTIKIGDFALRKKGREKNKWLSGHKSERELILNFKIFKYE